MDFNTKKTKWHFLHIYGTIITNIKSCINNLNYEKSLHLFYFLLPMCPQEILKNLQKSRNIRLKKLSKIFFSPNFSKLLIFHYYFYLQNVRTEVVSCGMK